MASRFFLSLLFLIGVTLCPLVQTHAQDCPDQPIPYTENFDSYGIGQSYFPDCWTRLDGTAYITYLNSTNQNVLNLAGYAFVATPTFQAPISTLRLIAELRTNNLNFPLEIGIMEDLEDWDSFYLVEEITPTANNTLFTKEIHFNTYTGAGRYIVFRNTGNYRYDVDNLRISVIPNCLNPTELHASSITAQTATLTWNETGTATQWRGILSPTPVTNFNTQNPFTLSTTSYQATNLTPNTTYYFYVQSVCGNENSEWSSTSFVTDCAASTLPVTESFVINQAPGCWSQTAINGNAPIRFVAQGNNPSCSPASGNAMVEWSSASNGNNWQSRLVSAPLNTTGINAVNVDFQWFHSTNNPTTQPDGVQIQYSFDGETWNNSMQGVVPRINGSNTGWTPYRIVLPEIGNRPLVYIGFLFQTGGGGLNCYLDEVSFQAANGCFTPINLTANQIEGNRAEIGWAEIGNATSWNLIISSTPICDFQDITPIHTTEPRYVATNLNPVTTYYVYVQSQCSSNSVSEWSYAYTFTTTCGEIVQLPFTESFENYGTCTDAFPACWVRQGQPDFGYYFHNGESCLTPSITDISAFNGDKSLMICTPQGSYTYTILPELHEDVRNLAISFFLKPSHPASVGTLEVGVMSNPNDAASFESIDIVQITSPNDWARYQVSFENATLSGSGNRLAFRHQGAIDNYFYLLDEITVEIADNCWAAQRQTAANITGNSVEISWLDVNEQPTDWYLKISDRPLTNPNSQLGNVLDQLVDTMVVAPVHANGYAIYAAHCDYLTGGTTYYYYILPTCNMSLIPEDPLPTKWMGGSFTTLPCNCYVDIIMNDSYGNGWEGAAIQLKHGQTIFAEATLENGTSDTLRVYTCEAANIDYYFVSGSYDSDISFSIINSLGTTIYTSSGTPVAGCFTSGTPACGVSCNAVPSNLIATLVANGVQLQWAATPSAQSYSVYRNNQLLAEYIPTTHYVDESTLPATENCYTVVANCIVGESSPSAPSCVTNLHEFATNATIQLFPNPAHDKITLQTNFNFYKVRVFNVVGKEVFFFEGNANHLEINTTTLTDGMYLVRIFDGKTWQTRKIVIK